MWKILTIIIVLGVVVGYFVIKHQSTFNLPSATLTRGDDSSVFAEPIANAKSRITKKPFGIKVSPQNSPVQPERFSGYHTGVDFETFANEQNSDVSIYAICDGKLVLKKIATGYGGVAVESCTLNGQPITVIYGHVRYLSITRTIGSNLKKGEKLGVLGKGYSSETDGERKHLHFGIHRGSSIVLLGYVQQQGQLSDWINFTNYLK